MTRTFHLPGQAPCPECGTLLDGAGWASGIDTGDAPGVGDFTVCVDCLTILRFGPGGTFARVTPGELALLEPGMRKVVADGLKFAAGFREFRKATKN